MGGLEHEPGRRPVGINSILGVVCAQLGERKDNHPTSFVMSPDKVRLASAWTAADVVNWDGDTERRLGDL